MHICHVVLNNVGGAPRVAELLASRAQASGHAVSVVVLRERDAAWDTFSSFTDVRTLDATAARLKPYVRSLPLRALYSHGLGAVRLRRTLRDLAPDIVVAHTADAIRVVRLAGLLPGANLPCIGYLHSDLLSELRLNLSREALVRTALRLDLSCIASMDALVFVSGALKSRYGELGLSHPHSVVSYNPLGRDEREAPLHPVAERWFSRPELVVFTCAARLHEQKDHATLLKAFAAISRYRPQARLLLLGDGPLRPALESLAADLALEEAVLFAGQVPNPQAYFSRSRAVVLSTHFEGMPLVLVEALACGRPFIASDCPTGPAEIAALFGCGTLVAPSDIAALAEALDTHLEQPPRLQIDPRQLRLFDQNECALRLERLCEQLLRQPARREIAAHPGRVNR